jgi:hypothetical protein
MKRVFMLTGLILMLVASVAIAAGADAPKKGAISYWVGAGYAKELESGAPSGSFGALLGVNYMLSPTMAVGVMSGYLMTGKIDSTAVSPEIKTSMIPITGQFTYYIPASGFTPYVGAGAGAYMLREKATFAGTDTTTSNTKFGFNLGAGAEMGKGSMKYGIDAKVHFVKGEEVNADLTTSSKFFKFGTICAFISFK